MQEGKNEEANPTCHMGKLHRKCLFVIAGLWCPLWSSDEKYQRTVVPGSQHETNQWDFTLPEGKTKWKTKVLTFCSFSGLGCRLLNLLLGSSTSRAPPEWRYEDQTTLPRPVIVGHTFYSTFLPDSKCGTGERSPIPHPPPPIPQQMYCPSSITGSFWDFYIEALVETKVSLALTLSVFWKQKGWNLNNFQYS